MKFVVTGGAGFIGSHLVDRLVKDGQAMGTWHEIVVVDNLHRGKLDNIRDHVDRGRVRFRVADARDANAMDSAMEGAEVVYHLAAQSSVMGAVADLDYSFTTNVVGTYQVLKSALAAGVRRLVFASSREAYGEPGALPVDEEQPLTSKNTYGASKVAGEVYCRVFQTLGLQTAILRLTNVYGPRDFGRVIPLWLDMAQAGQPLVVYGGQQLIDFIWIDVVVEALVRAASADIVGVPVNVGSGKGTPLLSLADRILAVVPAASQNPAARIGGNDARLDVQPARSVEVTRFVADVDRMRRLLGLEPPDDPLFGLPRMVERPAPAPSFDGARSALAWRAEKEGGR
jgi:UDP-glucose 4-epimerase